jgi:IclR family mhp operon transcriptional activator
MSEPERDLALTALGTPFDRAEVDRAVAATREAGYASAIGTTVAKISAIALPINVGDRVVGAINLVFFRSALSPKQAATKHLEQLRATVEAAELELAGLYHQSTETP